MQDSTMITNINESNLSLLRELISLSGHDSKDQEQAAFTDSVLDDLKATKRGGGEGSLRNREETQADVSKKSGFEKAQV